MKIIARRLGRFIFHKMPASWRYQLRRDKYSTFERQPQFRLIRQEVHRVTLANNAFIDVFWKALSIGKGPAASVVIYDQEILRLDCFGAGKGHFHASFFLSVPAPETRLFFPEATISQQIDRAVFEVTHNLSYYTQRSPYADVRSFQLDKAHLQIGGEEMRMKMQAYIDVSIRS